VATTAQQTRPITPPAALTGGHRGRFPRTQAVSASPTEPELMALVARGDHDAFIAVYERHSRAAIAFALQMIRNREAAEEIVQETFVNLWRRAGSYNSSRGSLRTFVLAIVRYRALDALRKQSVRPPTNTSDEGLDESQEAPGRTDVEAARREEAASVRAALGRLPKAQSRAIELAFFAGLSHSEIAAQLGMPLGTVKSRIRSGMEILRGELRGMIETTHTDTIDSRDLIARVA
jgi:RNA polymerase sigma-70 factor, ECF subfamily